ncbi:hypothetical protein D9757_003057 [Collybiopsis confluens]|uniref:Uncharacterized protein n=1 Tax=Collybiopsis confluens TaxID=2823264 RepID=A0A8H5ME89_9AGAR|nr:hypothetical protein D9757_003057 [Collybiopsis confluens]
MDETNVPYSFSDLSNSNASASEPVVAPAIPAAAPRPASPPPVRQRLRSEYEIPAQTTTRTGRVSRPAKRYTPES